jgi:hypothetical protein
MTYCFAGRMSGALQLVCSADCGGCFRVGWGPIGQNQKRATRLKILWRDVQLELFLNLMNDMKDHQVYVVKGVPTLNGRPS